MTQFLKSFIVCVTFLLLGGILYGLFRLVKYLIQHIWKGIQYVGKTVNMKDILIIMLITVVFSLILFGISNAQIPI